MPRHERPAAPRDLLFYKPYRVVSQFSGGTLSLTGEQVPTLADFIPVADVYPVGRLDHDSEGLLLLTNDGWLQHKLSDPRYEHPKTYWAQVEGVPTPDAVHRLNDGVVIFDDYRTKPARVRLLPGEPQLPPRDPPIRYRAEIPTAWLELTLTEGKNRQVRRMTAAVGFPTLRLVRVAIGDLRIGTLQPGEWRDLTPEEQAFLAPLRERPKIERRQRPSKVWRRLR